jgi:hypothetical protein
MNRLLWIGASPMLVVLSVSVLAFVVGLLVVVVPIMLRVAIVFATGWLIAVAVDAFFRSASLPLSISASVAWRQRRP